MKTKAALHQISVDPHIRLNRIMSLKLEAQRNGLGLRLEAHGSFHIRKNGFARCTFDFQRMTSQILIPS